MPNRKEKKTVVVMGAGLAGLACVYELVKNGYQVVVVEKNSQVGGLASTFKVGDFYFDTGPHRWFTKNDEVDQWFHNLLEEELIEVPRLTRIYFDKKFFYYPLQITNALKNIGPRQASLAIFDFFLAKVKAVFLPKPVVSMKDAYINQFGKTLYKLFFETYNKKLWGWEAVKLSGDWVVQRSRGMSILTIAKDALFPSKGKVVSLIDKFFFPKMGIGRVSEKLRQEIEKKGGKVFLESPVESIFSKNRKITAVLISKKGKRETIEADHFVSTIPIDELVSKITPQAPARVLQAAKKLVYRDEIFVVLFVKKEKVTPDNWIYTQDQKLGFVRVIETGNFSKCMSPQGTTSLVFEFPCQKGDTVWRKTDQEMINWATQDFLKEFDALAKSEIIDGYVHRQEKTYPTYMVGYDKWLKIIKDYLSSFANLQIAGRNGIFRYNNMDHSIAMGIAAARNIVAGKKIYDIEGINVEQEYQEIKKVNEKR